MPTRLLHRHDAYFKRLLDQPGTTLALLRERLPAVVARRLVDEEPEALPTSFKSDELEEIRPWLPELRYTLVDLGQTDSGFLSRHRVRRFGFKVLKYGARDGDACEILKMLIREALAEELDDEIVVLVRFVMMEPNGLKKGVLREMLTEVVPQKAERLMSIAEQCVAEGRAEGIVQGRFEGRVELILHMMTKRFGPVPDAYRRKIMGGTLEELDAWADALLEAKTLDEVLAAALSINS